MLLVLALEGESRKLHSCIKGSSVSLGEKEPGWQSDGIMLKGRETGKACFRKFIRAVCGGEYLSIPAFPVAETEG